MFSVLIGAFAIISLVFVTATWISFSFATPPEIWAAGADAIVVFHWMWFVVSAAMLGHAVLFVAAAASIHVAQKAHKQLLAAVVDDRGMMDADSSACPDDSAVRALKSAIAAVDKEPETPHACGYPLNPKTFRVLVGYAAAALTTVVGQLINAQFR